LLESEPEYSGKTTLLILPDFGRDADEDAVGTAFNIIGLEMRPRVTRGLWRLVPAIGEGVIYDRVVESVDVPTLGAMFGFSPSFAQGKSTSELV